MQIRKFSDIGPILFGNKTVKQTIFKNTFWLAAAEAISRLLTLILIIYVARILGATEYGKFTFAIAFVYLLSIFSDLGLSSIVTREFSREKEQEKEFSAIFTLKILLALGTITLIFIGSFFITADSLIRQLIWILAFYSSISCFFEIIYAFLRARQRMEFESLVKIFQAVLITGFGLFVILNFPSAKNLSYGYLFANLVILIPVLLFFCHKIYRLSFSWNRNIWKKFLAMSWPLALAVIFSTIYSQIDSTMMGYFKQITQVGWYSAASKIIKVTLIPAFLISQSFYPALSIAFKKSKELLQNIWDYYVEILILIAIPMMVGGMTLAPKIIDFAYNQTYYSPSVLVFRVLIIMAGIIFFYYPFNQVLIVSNQQRKVFWAVFSGALINVILNLILIPKFSLYGAAVATVATNILIFFLLLKFTLKFTTVDPFNPRLLSAFIGACFSSGIMYLLISQPFLYWFHPIFLVLVGIFVYAFSYLIYKKTTEYFLKLIKI